MKETIEGAEGVGNTVIDGVYGQAERNGDRLACASVSVDGAVEYQLTYRELLGRAESLAAEILQRCQPGDRAVLLFHGGTDFVVSFLACLIAGVIAVPGYPVRIPASSGRPARKYERLVPMLRSAEPKIALSRRAVVERQGELRAAEPVFAALEWIAVEDVPAQSLELRPRLLGRDVALLQYTSGSTSTPKGVMVSHDNLMSVLQDMDAGWRHDESSVMISWVPVFHDMGLVHGVLYPLFFGFPVYLLLSAAVLQQPRRWLEAITRFRGTHSAGPNFILDLCLKRISSGQMGALDLSTLRACLTGAEAVRDRSLRRFRESFAPCGLRPDAIQPGYGLAEYTLTVSSVDAGRMSKTLHVDAAACEQHRVVLADGATGGLTRSFVSCGWTHIGSDIRIVEPGSGRQCEANEIGEIWVKGGNLAQGYWGNPEATQETMGARLANGTGPFLRTGDLGFVVDKELYIAGRLKDLIIIRGRNLFPHDIEATVKEALPEVRVGRCCAFSIDGEGGEELVIVGEVDRAARHGLDAVQAFSRLRESVSVQHEAEVYDAVLVRTGTFPLTSSGKVQRQRARQEYLDGGLEVVARIRAPTTPTLGDDFFEYGVAEVRAWLLDYVARKLQQSVKQVPTGSPFERLGMDSLSLVEMIGELEEFLEQPLDPAIVFDHPDIDQLSTHVTRHRSPSSQTATTPTANEEPVAEEAIP